MSQTKITVVGTFTNPDETALSGQFTFAPTEAMVNGLVQVDAAPVPGILSAAGQLIHPSGYPLVLYANDDPATVPATGAYVITARLLGQPIVEFTSVVSYLATASDTATVTSGNPEVYLNDIAVCPTMVGQPVTGTGIPAGATVLSIDVPNNGLVLSANATASGLPTLAIGGVTTFSALQGAAQ